MKNIILASTSNWRLALLRSTGLPVESQDPMVDESLYVGQDPIHTAELRAKAKAHSVFNRLETPHIVIGADQVVHLDGRTYGKPTSTEDWFERLRSFRGRVHQLSTAVCLLTEDAEEITFVCTTLIHFRADIADAEINAYIADGEAKRCAGGYMMEQKGAWMIEKIVGDWQNVIGLPIFPLLTHLRQLGYRMDNVFV